MTLHDVRHELLEEITRIESHLGLSLIKGWEELDPSCWLSKQVQIHHFKYSINFI